MVKACKWVFILALCFVMSACTSQNIKENDASNKDEKQTSAYNMPLHFDDEQQLIKTINMVNKTKTGSEKEKIISIDSKTAGSQKYSIESDAYGLGTILEFYKPSDILNGLSFSEIIVKKEYCSFRYMSADTDNIASFTYYREMSPEVAMDDLYGRGAITEREIEQDGIKYVFLGWEIPETGELDGYSVHWVVDGRVYQASIPAGYTDEEMLSFCQFEARKI